MLHKKKDVDVTIEDITPVMAQKWLDESDVNYRRLDKTRVRLYAEMMSAGNWEFNGQTIQFDAIGKVIDGQHRLSAIVRSGCTIRTLVVWGVESNLLHLDRGKPRTIAQHLHYLGFKNSACVASAARLMVIHELGQWHRQTCNAPILDDAVIDIAERNQDRLADALSVVGSIPKLPYSCAVAVATLGTPVDQFPSDNEMVAWFWSRLKDGADLGKEEPVYLLRERWLNQKLGGTGTITPYFWRMYFTKAWNLTTAGMTLKQLKIMGTGPHKDKMAQTVSIAAPDN